MSNFGPPQIFPPVPVNLPGADGSIAAPSTESGVYADFFQPAQEVVVLDASRRGTPLQVPTTTVPPNVFQQED